jgi:hypothetical protein
MNAVSTEPMSSPTPERRPFRPGPGQLILRIAIIAVGSLIGIVLLSRGDIVLGLLILLFAGLRLVATVAMQRRRQDWRRQLATRRGSRR